MNECILVVDDDREIVKAISLLLEKEGFRVLKAYDGMQALELAADWACLLHKALRKPAAENFR